MGSDLTISSNLVAAHHPGFAWSVNALRTLLGNRRLCLILTGVTLVYLVLLNAGLVIYRCPLHATTGLSCPGCGLSAAILSMLRGDFSQIWFQHPFAPYFAMLGIILMGAALLPEFLRRQWNGFWIALEKRCRLHGIVLIIFCVFGALRLLVQLRITA